jgi:hypothetical protein
VLNRRKKEEAMNRLPSNRFVRRVTVTVAAALGLVFAVGAQPSFAAARRVDARTTDSTPGGRVVATVQWDRGAKGDGKYDGKVYGTVFDREGNDGHCALAQMSLDGDVSSLGRACANDREIGFEVPYIKTRQALVRVCLAKGGKLANCSEWK